VRAYRNRVAWAERVIRSGDGLPLFLIERAGGQLVGGLTLSNVRRQPAQAASLGYWVGEPMPGADKLSGAGVYYGAAYTEAMNFKDKHVFVVGGANSASQGALYLSRFASKVSMLVRGPELTSSQYLVEALQADPKIDLLLNTDLLEVHGEGRVDHLLARNTETNEDLTLNGEALFVFIGVKPQSQMVADICALDEKNQILTGPDLPREKGRAQGWKLERDPYLLETNVPGIFAAGDVRSGAGHRVASAVGEGAIAQALIKQYLKSL
jgi:thioredoxin reductase (NADPH)